MEVAMEVCFMLFLFTIRMSSYDVAQLKIQTVNRNGRLGWRLVMVFWSLHILINVASSAQIVRLSRVFFWFV